MSLTAAFVLSLTIWSGAQDTKFPPKDSQFPLPACLDERWEQHDPCSQDVIDQWRKDLLNWRDQFRVRIRYSDELYRRPELLWSQTSFMQAQVMAEDRYLYDPVSQKYTVDRYLDDVVKRFGGVDSVLIWPSYPNIGVDNRNQFDLARAMPGGVPAMKAMAEDFHKRGVHVLFPYNPWDLGTRKEETSDADAIAKLWTAIGADGINGDTMDGMASPSSMRRTKRDTTGLRAGRLSRFEEHGALEVSVDVAFERSRGNCGLPLCDRCPMKSIRSALGGGLRGSMLSARLARC